MYVRMHSIYPTPVGLLLFRCRARAATEFHPSNKQTQWSGPCAPPVCEGTGNGPSISRSVSAARGGSGPCSGPRRTQLSHSLVLASIDAPVLIVLSCTNCVSSGGADVVCPEILDHGFASDGTYFPLCCAMAKGQHNNNCQSKSRDNKQNLGPVLMASSSVDPVLSSVRRSPNK